MLQNGMEPWGYIMIPSGLVECLVCLFRDKKSYFVAGALPWFGLLALLLYDIYWRHSGHAQVLMWPMPRFWWDFSRSNWGSCMRFCQVGVEIDFSRYPNQAPMTLAAEYVRKQDLT